MNDPRPPAPQGTPTPRPANAPPPVPPQARVMPPPQQQQQPRMVPPPQPARPVVNHGGGPDLSPIAFDDDDGLPPVPALATAAGVKAAAPAAEPSKIKMQVMGMGSGLHTHRTEFKRKTSATGGGACRVRTFHGRLSDEGMAYMDDKINEWLDEHPDVEVKFVTSTVGLYDGKIKEQALIVNVWY